MYVSKSVSIWVCMDVCLDMCLQRAADWSTVPPWLDLITAGVDSSRPLPPTLSSEIRRYSKMINDDYFQLCQFSSNMVRHLFSVVENPYAVNNKVQQCMWTVSIKPRLIPFRVVWLITKTRSNYFCHAGFPTPYPAGGVQSHSWCLEWLIEIKGSILWLPTSTHLERTTLSMHSERIS